MSGDRVRIERVHELTEQAERAAVDEDISGRQTVTADGVVEVQVISTTGP